MLYFAGSLATWRGITQCDWNPEQLGRLVGLEIVQLTVSEPLVQNWLIVSTQTWLIVSTPLKNMKVSWDDSSQYMESLKIMFQTTNQKKNNAGKCYFEASQFFFIGLDFTKGADITENLESHLAEL